MKNAGKVGIRADDIDKVIITQWHTDHFGGAVSKDGRVLFSNGEYLISRVEAVHIRGTVKDWALGHLNAIEIRTIVARATTRHIVVDLQSKGQCLIHLADYVGHYLNFEYPARALASSSSRKLTAVVASSTHATCPYPDSPYSSNQRRLQVDRRTPDMTILMPTLHDPITTLLSRALARESFDNLLLGWSE